MKLTRQQQLVFDYLGNHPRSTIREIRDATRVMKPDMRCSEINYAHQLSRGGPPPDLKDDTRNLIINVGKNKYREVLKSIRDGFFVPKPTYRYEYDPVRNVMVQIAEQLSN